MYFLNQIIFDYSVTKIGAIMSGIQPGLTMVVGPPGTGKTDTAVQILNVLYHNCPSQRTLIITHSNQALNDLFEKIMQVHSITLVTFLMKIILLLLLSLGLPVFMLMHCLWCVCI